MVKFLDLTANFKFFLANLQHPLSMYILFAILTLSFIGVIYNHPKKLKRTLRMIHNTQFIVSFTCSIIFATYVYRLPDTEKHHQIKEATKEGVIALIIAILAYIEITVLPFWLILVVSYYLDM